MKDQKISPTVLQSSDSTSLMETLVMASSSTQPVGASTAFTLKPVMTLKGHEPVIGVSRHVSFISYFPDGEGIVSASSDKTTRQWDLRAGKEIEEARDIVEQEPRTLVVSRDGQWIVTSSCVGSIGTLQARDVKTRIVKTFEGHFNWIHRIDVSVDSMLLVGGSRDGVRLWSMETGELVAGPFRARSHEYLGVLRFSQDSKKFAVLSETGGCLEVWDVRTHKLDVKVGKRRSGTVTDTPIFWTTQDKSIVAVFDFKDWHGDRDGRHPDLNTIYEFDALTLEIVGSPFRGHTHYISGLALSFDCALLVSASRHDKTIKLWAFESRQLLASFDDRTIDLFIFSPNSHQLAYTKWADTKIYIYDPPPDILSSVRPVQETQLKTTKNADLLNSDATPRAARRKPVIIPVPRAPRPPPTIQPKQPFIRYLRKLLGGPPIRNDESRNPLDFPATSPLPRSLSAQAITQGHSDTNSHENSRSTPPTTQSSAATTFKARLHHLSTLWPVRASHPSPPIVAVPYAQGKERNIAGGAPKRNEDLISDEEQFPSRPTSPNPVSQQLPAPAPVTTEEHGSGRLCGCF